MISDYGKGSPRCVGTIRLTREITTVSKPDLSMVEPETGLYGNGTSLSRPRSVGLSPCINVSISEETPYL